LLVVFCSPARAAAAEYGIVPGSFAVRTIDAEGHPETRAGSHPDRLQMDFALDVEGTGTTPRDLAFELPAGLGGDPSAVPACDRAAYEAGQPCPAESQIGRIELKIVGGTEAELPMFKLEPRPGELVSFGSSPQVGGELSMGLRPSDYGVTFEARDLSEIPISEARIEMWGVPADHQSAPASPRRPFLTLPSRCGPLSFTFRTRSHQADAQWQSATTDTGAPLTECESLSFHPELAVQLSNPVADSPTGLQIDLTMPEENDPDGRAGAEIKNATIEMPAGITVSPGGVGALAVCTDAQLGLANSDEARCPAASKVGTVELSSAALDRPLTGTLYLGEEHPGERFRTFIVASGPGITLKFASALSIDPKTGRFSAVLRNMPEVPIGHLRLNLDGGSKPMLASPLTCGPSTAVASFEPSGGGAALQSSSTVAIAARIPGSSCAGAAPFSPEVVAGPRRPRAARPGSFSMTLRRRDGEQLPRRFSVTLPAGLSIGLGTVQACSDERAQAGTCGAESKVGTVLTRVGSGSDSVELPGAAYLTGPYRGAPFGLLMAFHATIGSFDLGTMTVRASTRIDERSGRVTVSADGMPDVIEGVGVRLQAMELNMDRPGLVRNPTRCTPRSLDATIEAQSGQIATATSPILPWGCSKLAFKPRIKIALDGPGRLRRNGRPGLRISARLRSGDAGLRAMKVSLPKALKFGIGGLRELCSRSDALGGFCPSDSQVGTVRAKTSLLSKPMTGRIYVVQPAGDGLPEMWLRMTTMGVQVNGQSTTTMQDGHLVTNFVGLPDMPLSSLAMRLEGGKGGLLSLGAAPCSHGHARPLVVSAAISAQNGARRALRLPIETGAGCGAAPGPGSRAPGRGARAPADAR